MQTYNVVKTYEGKPSKNRIEETNVTLERAQQVLDISASLWRKHGGTVLTQTDTEVVCEESDGSEVVAWTIQEGEYTDD